MLILFKILWIGFMSDDDVGSVHFHFESSGLQKWAIWFVFIFYSVGWYYRKVKCVFYHILSNQIKHKYKFLIIVFKWSSWKAFQIIEAIAALEHPLREA